MPIYEYVCEACSHQLEALQKINDAPLTQCPACQKATLKKRVSAAGFRLSGSGWYETDFKSGGKKNVTEKTESSSPAAATTAPAAHSCSGTCKH